MSRKVYRQRLYEIFRVLDAADGLVQLQTLVTKSMLRKRRPHRPDVPTRANRACKSIVYEDLQPVDLDVAPLPADDLEEHLPVDPVQRYRLVYERRLGGCSKKNLADDAGVTAPLMIEGSADGLAVNPPMLICGGAVLHTPAEVMATYSHQ
ncbi:hypothetical protein Hanom_Chr02g00100811 [Helianthus anomalus]